MFWLGFGSMGFERGRRFKFTAASDLFPLISLIDFSSCFSLCFFYAAWIILNIISWTQSILPKNRHSFLVIGWQSNTERSQWQSITNQKLVRYIVTSEVKIGCRTAIKLYSSSIQKDKELIHWPISLLFSFSTQSDITSCNDLPICLIHLSVT